MSLNDFRSVLTIIERHSPELIFNLAGQTSVGLSFEQPVETMDSIVGGTLNLLEAIRFSGQQIRLYNAGSSECFGDTNDPANEETQFQPRSPYAVAKSASYWLVRNYREAYDLFACTGILFNHESPLRPGRFVTQKIVRSAFNISLGKSEKLRLGNINIQRDWGWAPDYVEAMWHILCLEKPCDFVIATGHTVSLEYFVATAFNNFGLDWREHVIVDPTLFRPSDIVISRGDSSKANSVLGWKHRLDIDQIIEKMCSAIRDNRFDLTF
jgi:GDPmannose 4,6-dehydratase